MRKLSFVIPCYGSEKTLDIVVADIIHCVEGLSGYLYEIILVNDFSPDSVGNVIRKLCSQNPNIKGLELSRNFGQHSAMMAGFSCVTGDIIVDVDDDGQLPIEELYKLLDKIDEGYDIVIGHYPDPKSNLFRQFGTWLNNYMSTALIGKPKELQFTSFVVMKRFVVNEILRYDNAYPYLAGLMLRSSGRLVNVPVARKVRIAGKSGYSMRKLLSLWMNGFTAFSVKPLRIATIWGFVVALSGFSLGLYTIINRLINPLILAGYSSLMAVLLFLGGVIMVILGMIGEYVGRIYISLNKAPQYVIRETFNIEKAMPHE